MDESLFPWQYRGAVVPEDNIKQTVLYEFRIQGTVAYAIP